MRRRSLASILAAVLVLTLGRGALADERTEARAHFKKAMEAISNGHYEDGIAELKRAYEILPHPNVLYNIARAYVDIGDLDNAVLYYRRYLEGNPKDKDEVQAIVDSLEKRIQKQQARLLESQQQPAPAPAPSTAPTTPETAPPPSGALPVGPATAPAPPPAGAAAGPGIKTEDPFAETVVTASKGAQSPLDAANSTSIITEQDIRVSGITKVPELLRRLAGVDIMETTGAQTEVSLRGFNQRLSNKVLVLVDGRSVYVDLIGATLWSTLPIGVEDIERIEVVRGPGSALYGADAVNGVINIITKQPGEGKSGVNAGYGDHNQTHGSLWASGRDGDFAYRASAGYDYIPRWSREVPPDRQDLHLITNDQDMSQRSERLDLRFSRQLGKDVTVGIGGGLWSGSFETLAIGPINDLVITGQTSDITAYMKSKHVEARVFWNNFFVDHGNNATQIGQTLLPARARVDVIDGEVQYIGQFETGKGIDHDLHVGIEYRYKGASWTFQDQDRSENHEAVFGHDEVKLGSHWAIVGDGRADYVPYLVKEIPSGRGALLFHPTKLSTLRGSVASAFREPTLLESYLSVPVQLPVAGGSLFSQGVRSDDPSFKVQPERIFSVELGYLNQESDYFTLDTAFFYNHLSDLTQLAPNRALTVGDVANGIGQPDPSTGLYPIFLGGFENQCRSYDLYGSEVGVRTYPFEGLDIYGNYTFNYVHNDDTGCSAEQKALLVDDARTSEHKFNVGVQVRTRPGVDGEVSFHYVSPETWGEQVVDIVQQRIVYQALHLDAYTLLNASLGYRFLRNAAEVSGVAFNLLDDQHREHPFGQLVGRRFMGFFTYRF